ncbi:MAG: GNAT family protein [Bacteroidota bacterium]
MTTLRTPRLLLAPPRVVDIPTIVEYAGNPKVSRYTRNIPHPYEEKDAIFWLHHANTGWASGEACVFSIRDGETEAFLGGIGLLINKSVNVAELGYWLAEPFWGKGYVTEAVGAILRYGFTEVGLRRVRAHHMVVNEASGKVMLNNGMQQEGYLRQEMFRDGVAHDVKVYGILQEEFLGAL